MSKILIDAREFKNAESFIDDPNEMERLCYALEEACLLEVRSDSDCQFAVLTNTAEVIKTILSEVFT